MSDVPLEPLPDHHGRVVDIGEFRIRSGRTPWKEEKKLCEHNHLIFSQTERRVWCEDCLTNVDPFQAILKFHSEWSKIEAHYRVEHAKVQEGLVATLIRRAAKSIDRVWGSKMGACCPHCSRGIFPEDFANGVVRSVSREYEIGLRKRDRK